MNELASRAQKDLAELRQAPEAIEADQQAEQAINQAIRIRQEFADVSVALGDTDQHTHQANHRLYQYGHRLNFDQDNGQPVILPKDDQRVQSSWKTDVEFRAWMQEGEANR